jgi:transposase InsO family protein
LDITLIPGFLGSAPRHIALILDSFSRVPVAASLFLAQPSAAEMIAFVESAFAHTGQPRHLIVDQAGYFTATAFRERIKALYVNLRFCSSENHHANAKLERFWSTLKHTLLDLRTPVSLTTDAELEADLDRALRYYTLHRPHSGLGGATPAEIVANIEPRRVRAVQPPRGRRGENRVPSPFTIEYFEGDRRLPLLRAA